jgi:DedD protein
MDDQGLHEIQLHGKQLVFVVMTATVVAVAIFLSGVMVGRGVPASSAESAARAAAEPTGGTSGIEQAPVVSPLPGGEPGSAGVTAPRDPRYSDFLESPEPVEEAIAPAPSAPASSAARAAPSTAVAAPARARGDGFVVQVSAVKGRPEAETIRRRLETKGYPAFVEASGSGRNAMFRVRVGRYESRQAAEAIATRLAREERFKPWITR